VSDASRLSPMLGPALRAWRAVLGALMRPSPGHLRPGRPGGGGHVRAVPYRRRSRVVRPAGVAAGSPGVSRVPV